MLVSMVYALPGLEWDNEKDHTELFAGVMSVTAGELQDLGYKHHAKYELMVPQQSTSLFNG